MFSPSLISANLSECQKLEHDPAQIPSPLTVQSPIEAFFTNSPLKSLVASPQLRSKQNQVANTGTCLYHYLFLDNSTFKTWIAHNHRSAICWKLTLLYSSEEHVQASNFHMVLFHPDSWCWTNCNRKLQSFSPRWTYRCTCNLN